MAPHTTDREYGPGAGPPPAALSDDEVLALVASRTMGVLASVKRDGSPHLANMIHAWDPERPASPPSPRSTAGSK